MKWLLSIIHKYNIDLIIPGIEADMYAWIKNKNILEGTGCKTVLNNEALISLCADKLFFYEALIKELPQYSIFTKTSLINLKFVGDKSTILENHPIQLSSHYNQKLS